ncbi:MAG: aspartate kinase [Candidatus Micrarchaeia archaeon]
MNRDITVCKFGGSTLKTAQDYRRVASIISAKPGKVIAVVSATCGVTDLLVRSLEECRHNNSAASRYSQEFLSLHEKIAKTSSNEMLAQKLESALFNAYSGHNPKLNDYVLSFGERASAVLLGHFLGKQYLVLDSEAAGIASNGVFGNASCDVEKTSEGFSKVLAESKNRGFVITGFYGVDADGNVNLFGRGGSDYSAGVLAAVSSAKTLELYKDVPGFLAADPKMVKNPMLLEGVSFSEASELGYFGAKIIHPRTFDPLCGSGIDVQIRPVFEPNSIGTIIKEQPDAPCDVAAIASRKNISLVEIYGGGMVNSFGVAAEVFSRMAKNHISIDAIATSQTNISFTIDQSCSLKASQALEVLSLERPDVVWVFKVTNDQAMVSAVGAGLTQEAISRAIMRLYKSGVDIKMTSFGASKISFSAVIDASFEKDAVSALYSEFFSSKKGAPKAKASAAIAVMAKSVTKAAAKKAGKAK